LQVLNETEFTFQINLWLDETHLKGELLCDNEIQECFSLEERNHQMKQQYWGGYSRHNQIVQIAENEGIKREKLLVENHAIMMYNPFLEDKSKRGTKPKEDPNKRGPEIVR
jgi:vancomycin resistance protein VanW